MTQAAIDLWNDLKFIDARLWQQIAYLIKLTGKQYGNYPKLRYTAERFDELEESCQVILDRFSHRLKEINESTSTRG